MHSKSKINPSTPPRQAIAESTLIRVSSTKFDKKPLVAFDDCLTLIDGLLKFLWVFSSKDGDVDKSITNILTELRKIKTVYNELGGLFGMADTKWISLGEKEYTELLETRLAIKNPFVRNLFKIDLINEFVRSHIKPKYMIASTVDEYAPLALVSAVYQLIEFNSLPPLARQYGEMNYKGKVSEAGLHFKTAKGIIKTITDDLVKIKGKTSRTMEINDAIQSLTTQGNKISSAYNNFIQQQALQKLMQQLSVADIINPVPKAAPDDFKINVGQAALPPDQDERMLEIKLFGPMNNDDIPQPVMNNHQDAKEIPVEINEKELASIDPVTQVIDTSVNLTPSDRAVENISSAKQLSDKHFLKIIIQSLAAYLSKRIIPLSKRAQELFIIIERIQKTEKPDEIDNEFSHLRQFINRGLSSVEDSSTTLFKPRILEEILEENLKKEGYLDANNKLKDPVAQIQNRP